MLFIKFSKNSIYLRWLISLISYLLLLLSWQSIYAETGYMNTTDGKTIYYEVVGSGSPLVMIHGGDCSYCASQYSASTFKASASWDSQMDDFTKKFKVIRFDIRGFGQSSKVTPHPIDSWSWGKADRTTLDVVELMNYLGISKADILGLSIGSGIAAQLAVYYPQMVDRLVLASPWFEHSFTFTYKEEADILKGFLDRTLLILGSKDEYAITEADNAVKKFSYAPNRILINTPDATWAHFCNSENPSAFNQAVLNFLPVVVKVEQVNPIVSQPIYSTGNIVKIAIPQMLSSGFSQYFGISLPNNMGLFVAGNINEFQQFNGTTLPEWQGGEIAVDIPVTSSLPRGSYTVYLLRSLSGINPLVASPDQTALGTANFVITD